MYIEHVLQFFLTFSSIIIIVSVINYWMLVPAIAMSIILFYIRKAYVKPGRSLKRLEAISKCHLINLSKMNKQLLIKFSFVSS